LQAFSFHSRLLEILFYTKLKMIDVVRRVFCVSIERERSVFRYAHWSAFFIVKAWNKIWPLFQFSFVFSFCYNFGFCMLGNFKEISLHILISLDRHKNKLLFIIYYDFMFHFFVFVLICYFILILNFIIYFTSLYILTPFLFILIIYFLFGFFRWIRCWVITAPIILGFHILYL